MVCCISLMSTPALKPRPSARSTTTLVSRSAEASSSAPATSNQPCTVSALTGGASIVTTRMPSGRSSLVIGHRASSAQTKHLLGRVAPWRSPSTCPAVSCWSPAAPAGSGSASPRRSAPRARGCSPVPGRRSTRPDHYVCDVRDPDAVQALVAQVVADAGRLDVLVNNAGGAPYALAAATARPASTTRSSGSTCSRPLLCRAGGQRGDAGPGRRRRRSSTSPRSPPPGPRPAPRRTARRRPGSTRSPSSLAVEWGPKVRVNAIDVGLCRTEQTGRPLRRRRPGRRDRAHHPARPDGPARGGRPRRGLPRERPRVVRLRCSGRVPRRGRASRLPAAAAAWKEAQ